MNEQIYAVSLTCTPMFAMYANFKAAIHRASELNSTPLTGCTSIVEKLLRMGASPDYGDYNELVIFT